MMTEQNTDEPISYEDDPLDHTLLEQPGRWFRWWTSKQTQEEAISPKVYQPYQRLSWKKNEFFVR